MSLGGMIRKTVPALLLAAAVTAGAVPAAADECVSGPCHREVPRWEHVHEPVEAGDCDACHTGDASFHPHREGSEFRLVDGGGEGLCYGCHEALARLVREARYVHEPVRTGRCVACHRPHGSAYENLLWKPYPADTSTGFPLQMPYRVENFSLCWNCHDAYATVMRTTTALTRFRDGSRNLHYVHVNRRQGYACTACHVTHAGGRATSVERPVDWIQDLINFNRTPGGGACAPGCHQERSYRR